MPFSATLLENLSLSIVASLLPRDFQPDGSSISRRPAGNRARIEALRAQKKDETRKRDALSGGVRASRGRFADSR